MNGELPGTTYEGPTISNQNVLNNLPTDLKSILQKKNGLIAFNGGLHLRGICNEPQWHSLELFWNGQFALSKLFPAIRREDIPFGQDCMGDQYVLRDKEVFKLQGESGDIKSMKMDLLTFLEEAQENSFHFLELAPLKQLQNKGEKLEPGQLISVYPPFCTTESKNGVSLKPIPTIERILFLSDLAKQISSYSDGTTVKFTVTNSKGSENRISRGLNKIKSWFREMR